MNLGELDIICRFPAWEWFGTLTFQGRVPGQRKAVGMAINYLQRVAKVAGVAFSSLVWVLREETGEMGGRRHFHFLLSTRVLPLTPAGVAILERVWERLGGSHGMAKVKVYDRALSGAAYVTKCLSWAGAGDGAVYEVRKFQLAEFPPVLSHALVRAVARLERGQTRRLYLLGRVRRSASDASACKGGQVQAMRSGDGPGNRVTVALGDDKTGKRLMTQMQDDCPF